MTWKILVTAPYMQPVIEQYREMLEQLGAPVELIMPPVRERLSEEELLDWITDVDGAICGDDAFTERVGCSILGTVASTSPVSSARPKFTSKWARPQADRISCACVSPQRKKLRR